MKIQSQIGIRQFRPRGGFVAQYQDLIREKMIPYQYEVLCDRAPGVEKSHVVQNFINTGRALRGEDAGDGFYGMVFQDSDAAKWLEAAAYSLALHSDPELEKTADALIDHIAAAQDVDGYLNTYYTVKDREKRWENLLEGHELYCAGHMMEAACAYYEATGKRTLLDVMERNAAHIYDVFVQNAHPGYPGHPEVELALIKMYRLTGNEKWLQLSGHFIDIRGVDPDYYRKERLKRTWTVWGSDGRDPEYQQSAAPVRQQKDARGHSVRAMYLYTAMADMASQCGDATLMDACRTLWQSVTARQMYVTGGIGSTVLGEAFSVDYDLPGDTAYAETCASIGLMMFASRMLEWEVKGQYADVMELAFYNTVLSGMQADGQKFFYVNPLEVVPGIADRAKTHRHVKTQRPAWYACACCPPNVARLLADLGQYIYQKKDDEVTVNLFIGSELELGGAKLIQKSEVPFGGKVSFSTDADKTLKLRVRKPFWADGVTCSEEYTEENGYMVVEKTFKAGEEVVFDFSMPICRVYANPLVREDIGKVALMRGPLVYCLEEHDNGKNLHLVKLPEEAELALGESAFEGLPAIKAEGKRIVIEGEGLYRTAKCKKTEKAELTFIPYFAWANRGENEMCVWVRE